MKAALGFFGEPFLYEILQCFTSRLATVCGRIARTGKRKVIGESGIIVEAIATFLRLQHAETASRHRRGTAWENNVQSRALVPQNVSKIPAKILEGKNNCLDFFRVLNFLALFFHQLRKYKGTLNFKTM